MVATDAFATTNELKALEFPTQTLASMMLLFAFARRFQEVRQAAQGPATAEAGSFKDLSCA
jgi:hypothetical protein